MAEPGSWIHNPKHPERADQADIEQSTEPTLSFIYNPATLETTDPEYPGDHALHTGIRKYKKTLGEYRKEMIDALIEFNIQGEELWIDAANS